MALREAARLVRAAGPLPGSSARSEAPDTLAALAERIADYRQISGASRPLPKSLRELAESDERRQRERAYLRALEAAGSLPRAAQARLDRLNDDSPRPPAAKNIRAAEEAFLRSGLEALHAVSQRLAAARCRVHLGELTDLLAPDQLLGFARWIDRMNEPQRQLLRTVVEARHRHGPEYKRQLADNQDWIAPALARGIDLDPWFVSEPRQEVIGGRPVEILLASDLEHIFLMGTYFHTCLGLGDCNDMSVLANAGDANKQVLFMFTPGAGKKQVVGRQLIAISRDFRLLGYCAYISGRYVDKAGRQQYVDAMAAYCGRLAALCGLELADEGSPQLIRDHFWYDDGELEWPAAARAAWAEHAAAKTDCAAAC